MHSLLLLGWLGASAAGSAQPVTIEVQTHALANTAAAKGHSPAARLADEAIHEMHAHVDAQGRIDYDCVDAKATPEQRADTRVTREER